MSANYYTNIQMRRPYWVHAVSGKDSRLFYSNAKPETFIIIIISAYISLLDISLPQRQYHDRFYGVNKMSSQSFDILLNQIRNRLQKEFPIWSGDFSINSQKSMFNSMSSRIFPSLAYFRRNANAQTAN